MTLQTILTSQPFEGINSRIQRLKADRARRRKMKAQYDQTWRELTNMTDRERLDIGIHQSDIPRIAAEAAAMRAA
ncbi:DUF1127 domain-containing protein [Maribius pontilimi]|uniref:DUF1127 domain-containing protein n=1 Tax=Palleronia pontilimi TaxID=1964209 RepID=A0A934IF64_9RHOB|nr:DUF1127 domain-containing protein [Palleronia pontilimi]MBJ3764511.1 DUF1127 domain-containing protein [Palleronia pontilimi]